MKLKRIDSKCVSSIDVFEVDFGINEFEMDKLEMDVSAGELEMDEFEMDV